MNVEFREITESHFMRDSPVMISSTMPSAKYSCSGSPLIFWNGRTAIDGLFDRADALSALVPALAELDAVNLHRSCNILQLLVTCVIERDVDLALHVLLHAAGDADATGFSKPLQSRCDVDAIPENVVVVDDNVADVDFDNGLDGDDLPKW